MTAEGRSDQVNMIKGKSDSWRSDTRGTRLPIMISEIAAQTAREKETKSKLFQTVTQIAKDGEKLRMQALFTRVRSARE